MCDYACSSQLTSWLFTPKLLEQLRAKANRQARSLLCEPPDESTATNNSNKQSIFSFASGYTELVLEGKETSSFPGDNINAPDKTPAGHEFVSPQEERLLVDFYASKLPNLIGPLAQLPRLRRDIKVPATAALLFRRFFLSNSVMLHDPKAMAIAAAFLAAKVEDATTDIRYLEEGTKLMNAPVTVAEILPAEVTLLEGVHFDLMCFHPYKAVLALTEDLRTYLKSDKGQSLVSFPSGVVRPVVGPDLKPIHDRARQLLDDVVVSDVPLLYSPGQVALAALMVANDELQEQQAINKGTTTDVPRIDLLGYMQHRFDGTKSVEFLKETMMDLCDTLRGLKEGKHGCGNHGVDMQVLKGVHKKLKKCRVWGQSSGKKSKKRKAKEMASDDKKPENKRANIQE